MTVPQITPAQAQHHHQRTVEPRLDPGAMSPRELFHQAWRELRANGRIGYAELRAPRMRNAAVECLRMRLERDALEAVRTRIVYAAMAW